MSEALTVRCRRGWGKVICPVTGDTINVENEFETTQEVFDALVERYGGFEIVDRGVPPDDTDEDEPTCAGNDGECSRTVDEPGGYCWQHE